jgi:hypothetical protein
MFIGDRLGIRQAPSERHVRAALVFRRRILCGFPTELSASHAAATINMARLRRSLGIESSRIFIG